MKERLSNSNHKKHVKSVQRFHHKTVITVSIGYHDTPGVIAGRSLEYFWNVGHQNTEYGNVPVGEVKERLSNSVGVQHQRPIGPMEQPKH